MVITKTITLYDADCDGREIKVTVFPYRTDVEECVPYKTPSGQEKTERSMLLQLDRYTPEADIERVVTEALSGA